MQSFLSLIDQLAACSCPSERQTLEEQIRAGFEQHRAVLALDMSGYSFSVRRGGILPHLCRIRCMQRVVTPIISAHGGEVVRQIADNIMAVFVEPAPAICAAIAIHGAVRSSCNDAEGREPLLSVAIGIDYGRVLLVRGQDCFGDPVNIAYKLGEDVARAGEILVTENAHAKLAQEAAPALGAPPFILDRVELSISGIELTAFKVLRAGEA